MPAQKNQAADSQGVHQHDKGSGYGRFFAMIGTSTVVMFGLMYLNTYALDHVFFSQTRMWMALYMGGMMAIIMLAFMLGMYSNRRKKLRYSPVLPWHSPPVSTSSGRRTRWAMSLG